MLSIFILYLSLMIQEPKFMTVNVVEAQAINKIVDIDEILETANYNFNKENKIDKKNITFTGDSRFVGMQNSVDYNDNIFFSKIGMGYNYFLTQEENIKSSDSDILIVGFGVNDLYNVNLYIDYLNSHLLKKEVIFLTVNPVDENLEQKNGFTIKNSDIDKFNKIIKEKAMNYKVLDTNAYLKEVGFDTIDGLHYTSETYNMIYDFVISNI